MIAKLQHSLPRFVADSPLSPPFSRHDQLLKRLQGLPRQIQRIFLMCHLDGCSYAEIANRLNLPIGQVEKSILRVLQHCSKLRQPM